MFILALNRITEDCRKTLLLLVLVCFFCYGNTLLNEYAFDDDIVILNNVYVQKGLKGIPDLWTNPYVSKDGFSLDFRPLAQSTFALETQFFGNNPVVRHLNNLLLYVALTLIVFWVMHDTFCIGLIHPILPLLISLLFAVHPSHTEVVASVKNRDEIMSMGFSLLSLIYAFRFFRSDGKHYSSACIAVMLMILSLLSKSVSLPMAFVIMFSGFFFGYHKLGRPFYLLVILLLVIALSYFGVLAIIAKRQWFLIENPLAGGAGLAERLSVIAQSLLFYFKFMFYPYPFRFYYGYDMIPITSVFNPAVMASFILHIAAVFTGIQHFLKRKITGLFILSYFFFIANYSNIIPYPGIVSERSLFAPSLWFIAGVVLLTYGMLSRIKIESRTVLKILLTTAAFIVILTCCALTLWRNFQWKDTYTLMSSDIGKLENSVIANYLYANVLAHRARTTETSSRTKYIGLAKKHYRRAAELATDYFEPHFKLGMIYEYDYQNRDSAFYFFKKAYNINPFDTRAQFQLAKQYYLKDNLPDAERLFGNLYSKIPTDTLTLFFYAQVLYNSGKKEQALKVNDKLMRLSPDSYYAYYNYGMMFKFAGNLAKAVGFFENAVKIGYRGEDVYHVLLDYYLFNGMNDKATELQKLFGG
ncbi:MAG TPA: tetratricopeptide repeat protein [Chitinophagales bacterium]|nr:tetratricopeptide repeat protein [Chitinophagales bacterium]